MSDAQAIRNAATLVLVRRDGPHPRVLMGQRGAGAVFMPEKYVFPGGAVDPADTALAAADSLDPASAARLAIGTDPTLAAALPLTAVRELWEETGLRLATQSAAPPPADVPAPWQAFFATGARPRIGGLHFIFRAVTPPGRPRRFDARFFLGEAETLLDGADAITAGDQELANLAWLDLAEARRLPLPFITTVVLAEIEEMLAAGPAARPVPFFRHDAAGSHMQLL